MLKKDKQRSLQHSPPTRQKNAIRVTEADVVDICDIDSDRVSNHYSVDYLFKVCAYCYPMCAAGMIEN